MNDNESVIGVDVRAADGTITRLIRSDHELFELDGVTYRRTGNTHGVGQTKNETAVPVM